MINRHSTLTALLSVAGLVLLFASPVLAHRGRVFGPSFGGPGSGAGELSFLSGQTGVSAIRTNLAVDDATHDVYVADPRNRRVDEFEANGTFVRAWGWGVRDGAAELQVCTTQTTCRAGLSGVAPGEFMTPAFVAVDNSGGGGSGDVYVGDAQGAVVSKFTQVGQLIESWGVKGQTTVARGTGTGILTSGSTEIEAVAATTGAFSVDQEISGTGIPAGATITSIAGGTIDISKPATASGSVVLTAESVLGRIQGVAVDRSGELQVSADRTGSGLVYKFDSEGIYGGGFDGNAGEYAPQGLAVNGSDELYYVENAAYVRKLGAGGERLGSVTNKFEGVRITGIAVNSATGELYVDNEEGRKIEIYPASCVPSVSEFGPFCVPNVTFTNPALVDGAGLAIDTSIGSATSEAVYIVEVAGGKVESIVPEPPAAPLVEVGSESVLGVSGDSATLEAVVGPRSEAGEEPTSYRFQYTTEERFQREGFVGAGSVPVLDGQLAPSFEVYPVSARVQGLAPGTVYHYRVVAENAISRKEDKPSEGERDGAGEEVVRTFTTQAAGGFSLPDGRVWELVSSANKHGALIEPIGGGVVQASVAGDAFTYLASAPTESAPEGNSGSTQVLSTRGMVGASSWVSRDISTPREVANGLSIGGVPEYRFFTGDLSSSIVNPLGALDPSMSVEASERTAFLRTDFAGGDPVDPCASACYRPLATGAAGFANVPEGTEFGEGQKCHPEPATECGSGGPRFVGATSDASHIVLSSDTALTEGASSFSLYEWVAGRLELVSVLPDGTPSSQGGALGYKDIGRGNGVGRNAVSADGSRIVWSNERPGALYLRDMVREETVQLGGVGAVFQTASSDDTRVFFTVAGDLYVFEAPAGGALSAGHVTNVTPAGGVLGFVPGVSQDGSSVYFVADTVMTGSEANQQGETALAGQPNLYVEKGGAIKLVAVLSSEDERDWVGAQAEESSNLGELTSRVSPDGRWLAFMSERSLSGYDNRDVASGERDEEVFLYDATADGGRGGLVCASCDPTGARPRGIHDFATVTNTSLVDGQRDWAGRRLAGNVPGWISPVYQSRYLSDSGRLFFDSASALAPSDTNGAEDAYEYEPAGVGDCTSASVTFSVRSGGCVDLVSSGVAREESAFLDASESGDDVFFLTSAQLSKQDGDSVVDVYDARVGGGFPEPQAPPACEGDACQSPVAAPNDPTPGSLTYRGPGNPGPLLTASKSTKKKAVKCAKGRKLNHGKCVKSKKRAKKTNRTRKTGRAGNRRGAKS